MGKDKIIEKAVARLTAEIEKLRFQLAVKEEVLQNLRSLLRDEIESLSISGKSQESLGAAPTLSGSLAERARDVLRAEGRTMRARDIAKKIEATGFASSGKTSVLALVISAMRRRKDLFKNVRRGQYRLITKEGVLS